jgi:nicotinamidase-related amidase
LIIDIQEKLFPFISGNEQLTSRTITLIQGLKILNIPLVVTEQYTKGLGPTIQPLKAILEEILPIEKMAFSCCDEPGFLERLALLDKKFVVIAGIESHVCVLQTAMDLLEKGFLPVVVEDCVSSRRLNDKQMAIIRMRRAGAVITTVESVLFELLRYSGTDEFRAISKLVK